MNGYTIAYRNFQHIKLHKKSIMVKIHLKIDNSKPVGIPFQKITKTIDDENRWILPHGLELYVAGLSHNSTQIENGSYEPNTSTHILLTNIDLSNQPTEYS